MYATVFNRISAFQKETGYKEEITIDDKQEIGKRVAARFFVGRHKFIYKVKVIEPEGEFSVWLYPKPFCKVMDRIIKEYFTPKLF